MRKLFIFIGLLLTLSVNGQQLTVGIAGSQSVEVITPPAGDAFTDDFEALSAGDLDNQGLWRAVANRIDVEDRSGDNSIKAFTAAYCAYAYEETFADNQYAEGVLGTIGDGFIGLAVRLQADDSGDGYIALFRPAGIAMGYIDGGSYTALGTYSPGTAPQAGDTVRLEANGTTIRVLVNGVQRITATDATYSSGRAGASGYENGDGWMASWEGGDL